MSLNPKITWRVSIPLAVIVALVWWFLFVYNDLRLLSSITGMGGWGSIVLAIIGTIIALSIFAGLLIAGISDAITEIVKPKDWDDWHKNKFPLDYTQSIPDLLGNLFINNLSLRVQPKQSYHQIKRLLRRMHSSQWHRTQCPKNTCSPRKAWKSSTKS